MAFSRHFYGVLLNQYTTWKIILKKTYCILHKIHDLQDDPKRKFKKSLHRGLILCKLQL